MDSIGEHTITSPVFLVGAERSGTSLLRIMLNSHPEIGFHNEFEYAVDRISDDRTYPDTNTYIKWLATHRIFLASGFSLNPSLDYPDIVRDFLKQKQLSCGKPIIGATCHRHFDHLLNLWPQARFIHIVRDPRDVARSCIRKGWAGNAWHAIDRWIDAERLWDAFSKQLNSNAFTEIRYEDLINDTEDILRRLCFFIGVTYSPKMLEYNSSSPYKSPDPRLIEQWRHAMLSNDVMLVELKVGELLGRRGYGLSGEVLNYPSWLQRRWFAIHDRLSRIRFRIRRYGCMLVLLNFIFRRLGTKSIADRIQIQLNSIDAKLIK